MEKHDIGKSSLSEFKKKYVLTEQKSTEPDNRTPEKTTEPKKISTGPSTAKISPEEKKKSFQDKIFSQKFSPVHQEEILSEFEFEIFKNAVNLIYQSSYKRYESARATGMLNALNSIKKTMEIIKKRLNIDDV